MVGLVFAEHLHLNALQWTALGLNAAGWLWWYRQSRSVRRTSLSGEIDPWLERRCFALTAVLTFCALWTAFWDTPTSIDQQMLFEQARWLGRYQWADFLEALPARPYVEYQPPFFTFWVSWFPLFWGQQLLFFPFGLFCAGLMRQLYGRPAALLCATPVFALMIHQPCSDTLLFGCLLIVLRLLQLCRSTHPPPPSLAKRGGEDSRTAGQHARSTLCVECRPGRSASIRRGASRKCVSDAERRHENVTALLLEKVERRLRGAFRTERLLAALIYGLSWGIKPLTILTAPFLLPQLGLAGLVSPLLWGGYLLWSRRWAFGRRQLDFLLHQLLLKPMKRPGRRLRPPSPRAPLSKLGWRLFRTLLWRWERLGRRALAALPFYLFLFPAWLRPWTKKGLLLAAIIVLGYGNSKYLLLDLLFLFPVQDSQGHRA